MTRLQEIPESFSPINGQKLKILEILKIDFIYILKIIFEKLIYRFWNEFLADLFVF